jgi:hypothetical protein
MGERFDLTKLRPMEMQLPLHCEQLSPQNHQRIVDPKISQDNSRPIKNQYPPVCHLRKALSELIIK